MAALSPATLKKCRTRIEKFITKIEKNEPFVAKNEKDATIYLKNDKSVIDDLRRNVFPKRFETRTGEWIALSKLQKTIEFGSTGKSKKKSSERQEYGLINAIKTNPSKIVSSLNKRLIQARDNPGFSSVGKEKYIDIFIKDEAGQEYGVSCKDYSTPSVAGGGLAGIKQITPDLIQRVYDRSVEYLQDTMDLKQDDVVHCDSVPNFYVRIPDDYARQLVLGTTDIGGPIDYMYVGGMDVECDIDGDTMSLNGKFYTVDEYMEAYAPFYFRLRKRDVHTSKMVKIEYDQLNSDGFTKMLSCPESNKNNVRLVVVPESDLTRKPTILNLN